MALPLLHLRWPLSGSPCALCCICSCLHLQAPKSTTCATADCAATTPSAKVRCTALVTERSGRPAPTSGRPAGPWCTCACGGAGPADWGVGRDRLSVLQRHFSRLHARARGVSGPRRMQPALPARRQRYEPAWPDGRGRSDKRGCQQPADQAPMTPPRPRQHQARDVLGHAGLEQLEGNEAGRRHLHAGHQRRRRVVQHEVRIHPSARGSPGTAAHAVASLGAWCRATLAMHG